ncbi:hypothetical protein ACH5RR_002888 [Cinchona calisaya]|uniref:SKI-interacting protein SKIP SNW domain-containing protein n=1 Tax=Cinchona calisaya TaxID=153742 RepID=A0ABD3AT86_9GENT
MAVFSPYDVEQTLKKTKTALERIVNGRLSERMIRMVEMAVEPLELSEFKSKKLPKPSGSPPVPVMHSPPRPLTIKDCHHSSTVTPKSVEIHTQLHEALCVAQEKAESGGGKKGGEVAEGEYPQGGEKGEKERASVEGKDDGIEKRRKINGDGDGDRGMKVALGMATIGRGRCETPNFWVMVRFWVHSQVRGVTGDVVKSCMIRGGLNQEKGMDCDFANDDLYNIYDMSLFSLQTTMSTLYRPKKDVDSDM